VFPLVLIGFQREGCLLNLSEICIAALSHKRDLLQ